MGTSVLVRVQPGHRVVPMDLSNEEYPIRAARDWAMALVREWFNIGPKEDHDLVDIVGLIMSELVTNAALHAGSVIRALMLVRPDGRLFMKVVDPDPHNRPCRPTVLEEFATSGHGIELVEALAEQWGVESDYYTNTKTVWALLNFNVA